MFLGVGKLGPMAVGGGECVTAFHFQCPTLRWSWLAHFPQ